MWLKHVKTIRNNPPIITIDKWYVYQSQSWVVYGIGFTNMSEIGVICTNLANIN